MLQSQSGIERISPPKFTTNCAFGRLAAELLPEPQTVLGQVIRELTPSTPFDAYKLEISSYFASERVSETANPEWWLDHSAKFKYLSKIAINLLLRSCERFSLE